MFDGLRYLVSLDRPWTELARDVADILIVAFIVYRVLLVMKGTRAMQVGLGFALFGALYVVAKYAELATLMSVLSWLASSAILIVVVVFQNDIRRALIRVGSKAWLRRGQDAQERLIDDVVAAATDLARHRTGALVCIERDANVLEFVKNDGIELDCVVTRELLGALFIPEEKNKLHDGAIVIRNLRIARAGLFFPMPESTRVPDPSWGSRHRAAIGITEETDALVVVVSEETGRISLFYNQNHVLNLNGPQLRQTLIKLIKNESDATRPNPVKRATLGLVHFATRAATSPRDGAGDAPRKKNHRKKDKSSSSSDAAAAGSGPGQKTQASKEATSKGGGARAQGTGPKSRKTSGGGVSGGNPSSTSKSKGAAARGTKTPLPKTGVKARKSESPEDKKQSGRFTALPRDSAGPPEESNGGTDQDRVSVPMPAATTPGPSSASASPPNGDDRERLELTETPTAVAATTSVSKPMAQAELPHPSLHGAGAGPPSSSSPPTQPEDAP
ncbi:MAG: diadenylate cyclase [Myxococcota bacterium]